MAIIFVFRFFLIYKKNIIFIYFRYFVNDRRKPNLQALFLGAAISSKIFFVIGWLLYLHLVVPVMLQICALILIVAVPSLFFKIFYSDPGFITATHKVNFYIKFYLSLKLFSIQIFSNEIVLYFFTFNKFLK